MVYITSLSLNTCIDLDVVMNMMMLEFVSDNMLTNYLLPIYNVRSQLIFLLELILINVLTIHVMISQ
jgi:hypothetical protein